MSTPFARRILPIAVALAAGAGPALAQSTLYQNTFESHDLGPMWSANTTLEWSYPTFTTFVGRYSGSQTTLTLTQPTLPPPGVSGDGPGGGGGGDGPGGGGEGGGSDRFLQYTLTFDLYALDSWDGSNIAFGSDWFNVSANTQTLFRETIGNQPGSTQTLYAPAVGPAMLGYDARYFDSIYRQIALTFSVPADQPLSITWRDEGLQGLNDESWGIDNVRITYEVVPAPATLGLASALAFASLRRRRHA